MSQETKLLPITQDKMLIKVANLENQNYKLFPLTRVKILSHKLYNFHKNSILPQEPKWVCIKIEEKPQTQKGSNPILQLLHPQEIKEISKCGAK